MKPNIFQHYKQQALSQLKVALIKGEVDKPIIPYLEIINSKENLYTTSSCYGRITVDNVPLIDNKKEHKWLGKWHRKVNKEELMNALEKGKENITYIKQEPFILHIGVKTLKDAEKVLDIARNKLGLKRSGIMHTKPRIMLEIMGLDHVSIPAKIEDEYLIDLNKLEKITEILNKKFERNEKRFMSFIKEIEKEIK